MPSDTPSITGCGPESQNKIILVFFCGWGRREERETHPKVLWIISDSAQWSLLAVLRKLYVVPQIKLGHSHSRQVTLSPYHLSSPEELILFVLGPHLAALRGLLLSKLGGPIWDALCNSKAVPTIALTSEVLILKNRIIARWFIANIWHKCLCYLTPHLQQVSIVDQDILSHI